MRPSGIFMQIFLPNPDARFFSHAIIRIRRQTPYAKSFILGGREEAKRHTTEHYVLEVIQLAKSCSISASPFS